MMGHTDRETINSRRPLNDGMRALLTDLGRADLWHHTLSTAEKNRMRGLMDRGYARPGPDNPRIWTITEEGQKVL